MTSSLERFSKSTNVLYLRSFYYFLVYELGRLKLGFCCLKPYLCSSWLIV